MSASPIRPRATTIRDRLVEEHLPMVDVEVRRLARRLPPHVDREDLASAGRVALVQAARQYDPQRGSFGAFAARRLYGAMLDELRRGDWATRSVRQDGRRHAASADALAATLGRTPTRDELASAAGVSAEHLHRREAEAWRSRVASLEVLLEMDGADPVGHGDSPVAGLLDDERRAYLTRALDALPPRTRTAVVGRYLAERPLRDIATELGVSDSRASQLCTEGVTALRAAMSGYLADEPRTGDQPLPLAAPHLHHPAVRTVQRRREQAGQWRSPVPPAPTAVVDPRSYVLSRSC